MKDLTNKEIDRLDFVHNTIHSMLCALAGREIEWDISVIAEISDLAEEHICDKLGLMSDREFAPYVEDEEPAHRRFRKETMITTEMKWRTVAEIKPGPDTPVLVCSKCCEVDEGLYDEEDNSWAASSGFPLMFEVWMWAEITCPDGRNQP
jgi:hypothetical protein